MQALISALFVPGVQARPASAIGAELELIPVHRHTRERVAIQSVRGAPGMTDVLRAAADARATGARNRWIETVDAFGAPAWSIENEGRISFEPGGQIEISSVVYPSAEELIAFLQSAVSHIRRAGAAFGVELLAVGVDPYNDIDGIPAQLSAPRYDLMARHFDTIGPAGIRMMRQTASLQLNIELGPRPLERWRLLNSLAPYLTAALANSRSYGGRDSGYASYRALLWQQLDPSRTGLAYAAADPVGEYAKFAQNADRILSDDALHLTTLFPEVRPRGYFEIRSMDSVEPERAARAIRFISALTLDPGASAAALDLMGEPDPSLWTAAARYGMGDVVMAATIRQLERIAGVSISE